MRKLFFSFGILCMMILMNSCSASKKTLRVSSLDGEWNIVEVDGMKITNETQQHMPFIGFNYAERRIFGNSGCNRMMGTFEVDSMKPGKMSFGPIAGTRMACSDMAVEQKVLLTLEKVQSFESVESSQSFLSKVALCDAAGKQIVILEKRTAEPVNKEAGLAALIGEWDIKTVNGETLDESMKAPFIAFNIDEKRISGNAGCNSLNGAIKQEDGVAESISFGPIAATMMMCPDMEVERKVMEALDAVKSYKLMDNGELAFYNNEKNVIMMLQKK